MSSSSFDPYLALQRAEWRQRLDESRRHPGQTLFYALAALAFAALLAPVAASAWPRLLQLVRVLRDDEAIQTLLVLVVAVALGARNATRSRRQAWANDWLAAQPVAGALRRRRALRAHVFDCLGVTAPGALLLAASGSGIYAIAILVGVGVFAHAIGAASLGRNPAIALKVGPRETPFRVGRTPALSAWQWAEAGSSLAPARVAPLLLVLLLVPRGPWTLLFPALFGMSAIGLFNAFARATRVIVLAEAWLLPQGVAARAWLRGVLQVPLLLASGLALLPALAAAAMVGPMAALGVGIVVVAALALHLAVTIERRRLPGQIPVHGAVHLLLLVAVAQALPPLLPLLWIAQMAWLLRRGWR